MSNPHISSASKLLISRSETCGSKNIAEPIALNRVLRVAPDTETNWNEPSIAAASEELPGRMGCHLEDFYLLLMISCFLESSEIPIDFLFRGANPRNRWNRYGEIDEADALHAGICLELLQLLSNIVSLRGKV